MRLQPVLGLMLALAAVPLLSGCELPEGARTLTDPNGIIHTTAIDPSGNLSRGDYLALRQRGRNAVPTEAPPKAEPPIPYSSAAATAGPTRAVKNALDKPVTLTVTDSVPVRDVLLELMRKTNANMQLDPGVQGNVIITAHEQPFGDVLKRICKMAGLRARMDGAFIHVEPDAPYQKTYHLDYLSLSRKTTSETGIATNVFDVDVTSSNGSSTSSSASNGGAATQNNSTAKIQAHSTTDFWSEAEKSINQILTANARKPGSKADYSIDRQAGIVTVFGDDAQQQAVEQYFDALRRKTNAQVLIDARIVEVELNDTYQSGIDWAGVISNSFGIATNFGTSASLNSNGYFTVGVSGTNFSSLLNFVQGFGTTRVLSAPRVTVLNNQTAMMKVATNQVYFITSAQFTTTTNANGSSVTTNPIYTSTPRTVPVGFVMSVQPAIDANGRRVTMTLRPTISRVVGEVSDPSINLNAAVAGVSAEVQSQIPILAVREMDSVIQLKSGEIAIMGGLMQDSSINNDSGVPGLSEIPFVNGLFKSRDNNGRTSELLILLRATIAEQPRPDDADSVLYYGYSNDPRPMDVQKPRVKPLPALPADAGEDEDEDE